MVALGRKLALRECQHNLLEQITGNPQLLKSRIISSIQPSIGRTFHHNDLETKKNNILQGARLEIFENCAKVESNRDMKLMEFNISKALNRHKDKEKIEKLVREQKQKVIAETAKRLQKKVNFHLDKVSKGNTQGISLQNQKHNHKTEQRKQRNKVHTKKVKQHQKLRKQNWLAEKVEEIKTNKVINLSTNIEIPNTVYLYLARGLNFVAAKKISKEDLEFDAKEFLRKLEWKAYFKERDIEKDETQDNIHSDMRIPSRSHPPDQNNPLLESIRAQVMGFISTFEPSKPASNLTPAEQRGRAWLIKAVDDKKIFVTRADKGGATLLIDFETAFNAVKTALEDPQKFSKSNMQVEAKMEDIQKDVNIKVKEMEGLGNISNEDRELITGITDLGGKRQSPVFRAVVPFPYPLFKIHKCTEDQIKNKTVPPLRLVHSTKQGPLYRLEKWCSPYLTDISKDYCKSEFLLDTPDLIKQIEALNSDWPVGDKSSLFTLDVVQLYPSISVKMALQAMKDAFLQDQNIDCRTKAAVLEFSKLIFEKSFVVFQEEVIESKQGIPTGNCISRQTADMAMFWLLFRQVEIHKWGFWELVRFWKRYIDDIIGRWKGTVRQFDNFVANLNEHTAPFGIQFSDVQIGQSVNYLDVTLYLDEYGQVQYTLFRKETDARQYLSPASFHPDNVFEAVAFSQMLRIIERNSTDATCVDNLKELKADLIKAGHNEERLDILEPKAVLRSIESNGGRVVDVEQDNANNKKATETLVFKTTYFPEIKALKSAVNKVKNDIKHVVGDCRVIFALKKHDAIHQLTVKNRKLGTQQAVTKHFGPKISQACNGKGCYTCPILFRFNDKLVVNGQDLLLDHSLTCKSKSLIYVAQCKICYETKIQLGEVLFEDTYFGQTVTKAHVRFNGHRKCFKNNSPEEIGKSALSQHCLEKHPQHLSLSNFRVGIVKACKADDLDREENRFVSKFRTDVIGINRIKVIR